MFYQLFFLVVIISFVNRFFVINNAKIAYDSYAHLYFAKEVKDQKVGPFGKIKTKIVGSNGFQHPFLWHWLVGVISFDFIYKYKKWINAFLDSIFSILIYIVCFKVGFNEFYSFIGVLLYLFTPMLFSSLSTGPRIKSLTPRITSEFAVNGFFVFLLLPLELSFYFSFIITLTLATYTLLSSKFGIQAILFLTPLVSLMVWSIIPLLSLLTSILLVIIITQGRYIDTLKYHMIHLSWYFKKNLEDGTQLSNRNSFKKLKKRLADVKTTEKLKAYISWLVAKNSFGTVFFKMPILIYCLLFISYDYFIGYNLLTLEYYAPVLSAFIIFIIINIPVLMFMGEAERYLNHISVFIVLLSIEIINLYELDYLFYTIVLYGLIYWVIESIVLHKYLNNNSEIVDKNNQEIISFLNSHTSKKKILCYPYHAVGIWRLMVETPHEVIGIQTRKDRNKFGKKYSDNHPFLDLDKIDQMSTNLGLNFIIIENDKLIIKYPKGWEPPSNWIKEPIGGEIYTVYSNYQV